MDLDNPILHHLKYLVKRKDPNFGVLRKRRSVKEGEKAPAFSGLLGQTASFVVVANDTYYTSVMIVFVRASGDGG